MTLHQTRFLSFIQCHKHYIYEKYYKKLTVNKNTSYWREGELEEHFDMWRDACEELGIEDVVMGFLEATNPEISSEVLNHLCKKFNIDRI